MTDLNKFSCLVCKYSTNTNANLKKHFTSKKHETNSQPPVEQVPTKFQCKTCNKYYKSNTGLWGHNKTCKSDTPVINNSIIIQEPALHQEKLEDMIRKMNEEMNSRMDKLTEELKNNQQLTTTTINNTTINNTFNMNVFLNEKCGNAMNFDDFVNKISFQHVDIKLVIGDYVEDIPINMRPLHILVGEDPYQQLIHIRQDDKWNMSTELNWMQQIHSDDDDLVENKNPIYYALQKIDEKKLEYLSYYRNQDKEYMLQHGRLKREISRPDFKEKVYQRLRKMITLDTNKLDGIDKKSKILIR